MRKGTRNEMGMVSSSEAAPVRHISKTRTTTQIPLEESNTTTTTTTITSTTNNNNHDNQHNIHHQLCRNSTSHKSCGTLFPSIVRVGTPPPCCHHQHPLPPPTPQPSNEPDYFDWPFCLMTRPWRDYSDLHCAKEAQEQEK